MITLIDKWGMCGRGHYVYDRTSCARCDGYDEFPQVVGRVLGNRVALWDGFNYHPMDRADVVNGWRPGRMPPTGWMVYYLTFTDGGRSYWKVGVTQAPYDRLMREVAPAILDLKYVGSRAAAEAEARRISSLYSLSRVRIARLGGVVELFDRDVLNGRLK